MLLAPWWERIRDLLDGDIAVRARRLADGGLERLFADLNPSIHLDGDTLAVSGRVAGLRDLAGEGLVLMPSAFVWPGVVLVLDPPWQPTLIYPARGIAGLWQPPAGQLPAALGRLLGRTRARLLLALAEPASTAILARRLGCRSATPTRRRGVRRRHTHRDDQLASVRREPGAVAMARRSLAHHRPIEPGGTVDDASGSAGASREHDTHQPHAMAPGLVG
jgi:Family of unknown function (DUF5937)